MRICVAAICRNEEKNIEQFLEHVKLADAVSIIDTGSTDSTNEYFERFEHDKFFLSYDVSDVRDLARSRNLAAAPFNDDDLIVWLDIDERFSDPDWVNTLRTELDSVTDLRAIWIQMHNGDSRYGQKKAYRKDSFVWRYCAHEVLIACNPSIKEGEGCYDLNNFHTDHFPDRTKPRNYLNELARDVAMWPHEDRPCFYYARELCYCVIAGQHELVDEAVSEVRRLEKICNWRDYLALIHTDLLGALYMAGRNWLPSAYASAAARPDRVESYATAADAFYRQGDDVNALGFAIQGIAAHNNPNKKPLLFDKSFSNLELCFDVARWSCQNLGMYDKALHYLAQYSMLRGDDVNQSIEQSGLVEKVEQGRAGAVSQGSPTLEAQSNSQSAASSEETSIHESEQSPTQEESSSTAESKQPE